VTGSGRFLPGADDADLRREKARARELRQSARWKRRIAAEVATIAVAPWEAGVTLDHVIPVRGGRSVREMVASCKDCNSRKQSLLPWEWDAYLTARAPFESD
jgi:hypothetical protein